MKVKLTDGAFLPKKAHDSDAGFDLFARENFTVPRSYTIDKGSYSIKQTIVGSCVHDTGVCVELPENTVGMIKSKSGLNVNHGITAEGVVDVGYTGSIKVKFYNHTHKPYIFNKGDKITQLVIMPIVPLTNDQLELVDDLSETDRGSNGFGSTGK